VVYRGREAEVVGILQLGSCVLVSVGERQICAESLDECADGVRTVVVRNACGDELGRWGVEAWHDDADRVAVGLVELGYLASGGSRVMDPEYGPEYAFVFADGSALRIDAVAGTTIRLVGRDGAPIGAGSLYWTCDEIAEDPVEVMGGVIGAAARVGGV
jgi:hypothetical protein